MDQDIIVDVDIHHTWASDALIADYLPEEWKGYFKGGVPSAPFGRYGRYHPPHLRFPQVTGGAMRPEATPPGGGPAGSHYETLRDQHLDPHRIDRALLTWGYGLHPGLLHAAASVALCRATNDYMVDYWLRDERLFGTLAVPVAVPEEAAKEIRRLGAHRQIAGVLMAANPFNKPMGHPVYHPIFAAAQEMGQPIVTHVGSDSVNKGSWSAGGLPTTKVDYYTLLEQSGMHHLTSLLAEGVFEKFPGLHVLLNEYGSAWMPWLLWSLDSRYQLLRIENPSLRRLPSEYFRDHVWASTQPFAIEADPRKVIKLLECFGGMEDKICYSSDYPHWDTEWPHHVASRVPAVWRPKVMGENACRLFGWKVEEVRAEARARKPAAALAGVGG